MDLAAIPDIPCELCLTLIIKAAFLSDRRCKNSPAQTGSEDYASNLRRHDWYFAICSDILHLITVSQMMV